MMNAEFARLCHLMCRLRDLLLNTEKWEWAAWMDRGVTLMEQRDPDAVERFLAAFGGIDGIDHNLATPMNERDVSTDALEDVGSALAALLTEAHVVASQLREMSPDCLAVSNREEHLQVEVRDSTGPALGVFAQSL